MGYKTARPKTGDWERLWRQFRTPNSTFSYFLINHALLCHFLANWLAHNKNMTEKSVFREAWSPELMSQSFPVSCFWNLKLLAHQNTGKKNRYRKIFLLHLSAHWGDLSEQIKKICHIHFKNAIRVHAPKLIYNIASRAAQSNSVYVSVLQISIVHSDCASKSLSQKSFFFRASGHC